MADEHDTSIEAESSPEAPSTPEQTDQVENQTSGGTPTPPPTMSLQKAVDLGEYDPEFLSGFPEWHSLSPHAQLQYIRQALDNRERQLVVQWAEISNVIDFSKKPHLDEALKNIENQRKKVNTDREKLYIEYSRKS